MDENIFQEINKILEKENYNGNVLIASGNDKLFEKAYGFANFEHDVKNNIDSVFKVASISKSITASAILKLVDDDMLKLDSKVSDVIKDFPNGDKITIHQILSNTSGLAGFDIFGDYREELESEEPNKELINHFKGKPFEFEPGTKYDYSNSGYLLLSRIIEVVTNMKYEEYLKKVIFKPLGINNTDIYDYKKIIKNMTNGYDMVDGKLQNCIFIDIRLAAGGGALCSTLNDLFLWDKALFSNKIISKDLLDKMITSHTKIIPSTGYGYGWFVYNENLSNGKPLRKIYHTGGGPGVRTINAIYPDLNLFMVMLSNVNDSKKFNEIHGKIEAVMLKEATK